MSWKRALPSKGCACTHNGMCSQEERGPHPNPTRSWLRRPLHLHLTHSRVSTLNLILSALFSLLPACDRLAIKDRDLLAVNHMKAEQHCSGSADPEEQPPEGDASLALAETASLHLSCAPQLCSPAVLWLAGENVEHRSPGQGTDHQQI